MLLAFWVAAAIAMLVSHAWGAEECRVDSGEWIVTAYCPCRVCCGPAARGVTASGRPARGWLVAGPPELPLGTRVIVPGYAGGVPAPVLDRGGAIKGRRLDVLFPTHGQARAWGVRRLDAEVLR